MLGYTSGLRAEELYTLTTNDINLEKRIIYVRHDPLNNHSTKNKKSRISFFNQVAQKALFEYINTKLFPIRIIQRKYKNAPIRVKDLQKYFSQE